MRDQPSSCKRAHGNAALDSWYMFRRGGLIFRAGEQGKTWRVVSGSIRLDRASGHGLAFGGLAVPGDVIGVETLLFGRYNCSARALAPCVLEPWLGDSGAAHPRRLLQVLMRVERRVAEVMALRSGRPLDRVQRLIRLLARPAHAGTSGWIGLPRLSDMAEITDLSQETVSRIMAELKRRGDVQPAGGGVARVTIRDPSMAAPSGCP